MPELIDRQRAITEIESCFCSECDCGKDKSMCGNCEYLYCMDILEQQPTIEPEVRHGRWVETRYNPVGDTMYCDCNCYNCNFEITREKGRYPKFCENCGADMREEQEG